MKNFGALCLFFILAFPAFAAESYELQTGKEYMFFSDSKIQSIKSNNPEIISAQRVMTYTGAGNQIIFYAKKSGMAAIRIQTDKGVLDFPVEIKNNGAKLNDIFVELDFPGIERE